MQKLSVRVWPVILVEVGNLDSCCRVVKVLDYRIYHCTRYKVGYKANFANAIFDDSNYLRYAGIYEVSALQHVEQRNPEC